jgi:transposase
VPSRDAPYVVEEPTGVVRVVAAWLAESFRRCANQRLDYHPITAFCSGPSAPRDLGVPTMPRKRDFDKLERRRMQAAKLLKRGFSQAEVARKLKVSRESVRRWSNRIATHGSVKGLKKTQQPGRNPKLEPSALRRLIAILKAGPRKAGFSTGPWTLARIAAVIRKEFGVRHHPAHVGWILSRKLGMRRTDDIPGGGEEAEPIADAVTVFYEIINPQGSSARRLCLACPSTLRVSSAQRRLAPNHSQAAAPARLRPANRRNWRSRTPVSRIHLDGRLGPVRAPRAFAGRRVGPA